MTHVHPPRRHDCECSYPPTPAWEPRHIRAANKEGWDLFECGDIHHPPFELQRIDCQDDDDSAQLDSDDDAWRIVREGFLAHKALYLHAMRFLEVNSPVEFEHIRDNVSYGDVPYDPRKDPVAVDGWGGLKEVEEAMEHEGMTLITQEEMVAELREFIEETR